MSNFLRKAALGLTLSIVASLLAATSAAELEPLRYTADGKLIKPTDYRQWVLIGTGLNMAYGPLRTAPSGRPPFTNVFVNPTSYRALLEAGVWPDKTVFVLEIRESNAVNKAKSGSNGYYQGEIVGIEAEVKDEKRYPGKWAFFGLSLEGPAGAQIPSAASCYSCHATNAAVENTFVQFYPVLRDVAKRQGTLKNVREVFKMAHVPH